MPKLVVRLGTYFSPGDEDNFFRWLQSIKCVSAVRGQLRDLHITLSRQPSDAQLRELIALLHRYKLNKRPLRALLTPRNRHWFASRDTYWYRGVFGSRGA